MSNMLINITYVSKSLSARLKITVTHYSQIEKNGGIELNRKRENESLRMHRNLITFTCSCSHADESC